MCWMLSCLLSEKITEKSIERSAHAGEGWTHSQTHVLAPQKNGRFNSLQLAKFLTCHCHEIYREQAVLNSSNYTLKIMIFVNMWNLWANSLKNYIL